MCKIEHSYGKISDKCSRIGIIILKKIGADTSLLLTVMAVLCLTVMCNFFLYDYSLTYANSTMTIAITAVFDTISQRL